MKISLSSAKEVNTIKGFGASACWWSTRLENERTAEEVSELLYGDSGLKMNIYRYNVGAGFEEGNVRVANPWRVIESFMNNDGTYDWSRDKNAVMVMDKALARGNIDTLIFFCNSPHINYTVTHQASGGLTEHFSNCDKNYYDEFAKYLIDIAEHFIKNGYPVKYISPINEPQWKWGGGYVWQEGCHYEPEEVRDCLLAFARELERRNSPLLLYAPESGNISELTMEYYELLSNEPLIMKHLDAFAYHSYGADDDIQKKIAFGKWARDNVKTPRFDMSEWCELPCRHDTGSIESTLIMARVIGEDLIFTGADSWTAWVGVNQLEPALKEGLCYSDGLLTAKNDWSDYYVSMRYYAMAHYTKYLPVGSRSLDIGIKPSMGFSIFAFEGIKGEKILIAVNNSRRSRVIEPDICFSEARVIMTDQNEQLKESVQRGKKIIVPAKSMATIILK